MEIQANNVTTLYNEVMGWAKVAYSSNEGSRLGLCKVLDEPLTIRNTRPDYRVIDSSRRNANPFFHMMEAIWMFAGSNDDWITRFNSNMTSYMELHGVFHGAYGYRWREHFGFDQIGEIIKLLKADPGTRRAYLGMWDPFSDLGKPELLDLPCNVGMAFQMRNGKLNGYVNNRSNDLIWGMLGTNCVHFSMLLEVVAYCTHTSMGNLYQTTCNPHIYKQHWPLLEDMFRDDEANPLPYPLCPTNWETWTTDAEVFVRKGPEGEYLNNWFKDVAVPMYRVYINKEHDQLGHIGAADWQQAAFKWVEANRAKS